MSPDTRPHTLTAQAVAGGSRWPCGSGPNRAELPLGLPSEGDRSRGIPHRRVHPRPRSRPVSRLLAISPLGMAQFLELEWRLFTNSLQRHCPNKKQAARARQRGARVTARHPRVTGLRVCPGVSKRRPYEGNRGRQADGQVAKGQRSERGSVSSGKTGCL